MNGLKKWTKVEFSFVQFEIIILSKKNLIWDLHEMKVEKNVKVCLMDYKTDCVDKISKDNVNIFLRRL